MSFEVPVALFVFNRPESTRRVLEAIRQVRPRHLFVIADGPRETHPGDEDLVAQVRELFHEIDWDCCLETHWAEKNMGCKSRLSSGLDWVFSQVDRAIILEDDTLPDVSFFPFCEAMLERYIDYPEVHMVRGSNTLPLTSLGMNDSYYFSRIFNIWGWATWARAWENYDFAIGDWPEYRHKSWLRQFLPSERVVGIIFTLLEDVYRGKIDSWEFQWAFAGWKNNAFAIAPNGNLVSNIGFDDAGTHMRDKEHPNANRSVIPMTFPLRHPSTIEVHVDADSLELEASFPGFPSNDEAGFLGRLFSLSWIPRLGKHRSAD